MEKTKQATGDFSVIVFFNGKELHAKADSVVGLLDSLPIEPLTIKAKTVMQFGYKGLKYQRMYNVAQLRRLLGNDTTKEITAKFINTALGVNKNG